MTRRYHANNFSTTLATTVTAASTTFVLTSVTGLPTITTNETYRLTITALGRREIVICTSRSGTSLTVTRAAEGTTAIAWQAGATIELRGTADSYDRKQDRIATTGDVIDFGDATSFEIPSSAAPALTVAGQIALDTTVTDYADGLLCYRAGSTTYGVPAISLANLTSPGNGKIIAYNSTNDDFELVSKPLSIITASLPGELATFSGSLRWYPPSDITLTEVFVSVATPPTATDAVFNVQKNGADIFTSPKPTIVPAAFTSTPLTISVAMTSSDYLTVSCETPSAAEDATIRITYS